MTTVTLDRQAGSALELDIRIVEAGSAVSVLLGNTDDGCDTLKNGDC
ncbi:hypothetical protein [Actinoallomurus rhizosphaericola]|nr:hypothetical protein [Actinoallomurus rhizosphaericola]MCO5994802.1 hypothetical protein [Actinoallomurus rhizosphaericola]